MDGGLISRKNRFFLQKMFFFLDSLKSGPQVDFRNIYIFSYFGPLYRSISMPNNKWAIASRGTSQKLPPKLQNISHHVIHKWDKKNEPVSPVKALLADSFSRNPVNHHELADSAHCLELRSTTLDPGLISPISLFPPLSLYNIFESFFFL